MTTTAPETTDGSTALRGVVPPLLTPLTAEGDLDRASLSRLVGRLVEAGVDGIFALGSSGEVAYHDDAMRDRVLDAVVGEVAGQVPVLAGVIDMQAHRVISHVRAAEKHGVAGVVATAPFYAITGPDEIGAHFRAIGAASSVPVWAYDIPVCVHVKLAPAQLMELAADGAIAGVKDSSGDDVAFRRLAEMNRAAGSPLTLLTGHEVVVDGAYLSGADGSVPGLGNVDPAGYVRMDRAARAGDWDTVRAEQDRLAALFEIVFQPTDKVGPAAGVGAFKTALRELGVISTNAMSLPMTSIEGEAVDRIRAILDQAGLLDAVR
ncbi:dihydrodipicolinate synthase family protein [Brachybacterium sp. MASK1Z-5]|uniref:Dihydrodipicolinate synthase family protein n=1 Tax=Brachybacterium halotolerans TaxID=2795215 RepID=A0ABS1B8W4_9MICO|nr:dihydrodipicolinate synthase family protein [Brachybacterium halotolerans]MBK0331093.1 dihydrodipicolinate synthase family protein [Brachybacterium halotolerans]